MTSYINKFKDKKTKTKTTTCFLWLKIKHFLKITIKWEKIESLMRKKLDSKLFYGNNDNNYIKTKKNNLKTALLRIFIIKEYLKKKYHIHVYQ